MRDQRYIRTTWPSGSWRRLKGNLWRNSKHTKCDVKLMFRLNFFCSIELPSSKMFLILFHKDPHFWIDLEDKKNTTVTILMYKKNQNCVQPIRYSQYGTAWTSALSWIMLGRGVWLTKIIGTKYTLQLWYRHNNYCLRLESKSIDLYDMHSNRKIAIIITFFFFLRVSYTFLIPFGHVLKLMGEDLYIRSSSGK